MSDPLADDEKPLDPEVARIVSRVRLMMVISAVTTLVAVAAVLGVIGYRLFRAEERPTRPIEATAMLPQGARIVATAVAQDRLVVTVDVRGAIEVHTFDLRTLRPAGRLRFATEP